MAPPGIGLLAYGLTPCRAYVSHAIAPDFEARLEEVRHFEVASPAERLAFLDRARVRHLILPGDAGPSPVSWLGPNSPFVRVATAGSLFGPLHAGEPPMKVLPPDLVSGRRLRVRAGRGHEHRPSPARYPRPPGRHAIHGRVLFGPRRLQLLLLHAAGRGRGLLVLQQADPRAPCSRPRQPRVVGGRLRLPDHGDGRARRLSLPRPRRHLLPGLRGRRAGSRARACPPPTSWALSSSSSWAAASAACSS